MSALSATGFNGPSGKASKAGILLVRTECMTTCLVVKIGLGPNRTCTICRDSIGGCLTVRGD